MNELNYASLEASKRLLEAGIVLETERAWASVENLHATLPDGSSPREWKLISVNTILYEKTKYFSSGYVLPAPSMAEVWREFKDVTITKVGDKSMAWQAPEDNPPIDNNPTDALIDLLIWTRKEKP